MGEEIFTVENLFVAHLGFVIWTNRPGAGTGAAIIGEPNPAEGVPVLPLVPDLPAGRGDPACWWWPPKDSIGGPRAPVNKTTRVAFPPPLMGEDARWG